MQFRILAKDTQSQARCGEILLSRGSVPTPAFMPVGTQGTVKAVHFKDLEQDLAPDIMLGNTYHLYLRPGMDVIQKAGGIHGFNTWQKPVLTDSGGYQVYSLAQSRKITEEGVLFQSHIDGSRHFFSPEKSMEIQRQIGADIIMAFDECPALPSTRQYLKKSMELTHRWLDRCVAYLELNPPLYGRDQVLFPIVQGGTDPELRRTSAREISDRNLPGNAIGGLSVGEPDQELYAMTELVCGILPPEKPRYLMGVGTPENLLHCIALGVDMFDCVMPTRNARNGMLFTWNGIINIRNKKWEKDLSPIDEDSALWLDQRHSKAYLRHLFISGEIAGPQLASLHNLHFYLDLMRQCRKQIQEGTFTRFLKSTAPVLAKKI